MKLFRKLISILGLVGLLTAPVAFAQSSTKSPFTQQTYAAADFGQWAVRSQTANTYQFSPGTLCSATAAGSQFFEFATNAPVLIVDATPANTEAVAITSPTNTGSQCGFTPTGLAHSHYSFQVRSGTAGLQEALNALKGASATYPALVVLDRNWFTAALAVPSTSPAAIIAAAKGGTNINLEDITTAPVTFYTWSGTQYLAAAIAFSPGTVTATNTVSSAAPGQARTIIGAATTSNASFADTSSSLVGVRGVSTIPGTTTASSGYIYGTQGKFILTGTVNGTTWDAGVLGQIDISAATLTAASHVTPFWSDAGATGPAVSCTFCDSAVLTNTTATTFNSLIYGYSKAGYLFDLSNNGSAFINGSTASAGSVTGYLKIKVNGTDAYIAYKGTPGT